MFVQHHVHDKVDRAKGEHLVDILPHGIAFQLARVSVVTHHHRMISLDRVACAHPRHNCLRAARKAREIMIFNIAKANAPLCLGHRPENIVWRSTGRDPHAHAVRRIMVDTAYTIVNRVPHQFAHFRFRMLPVGTKGKNDGDIAHQNARRLHFREQRRQHIACGKWPCNIAGDDRHAFAGVHDFAHPPGADGLFQCPAHRFPPSGAGLLHRVGGKHRQQAVILHNGFLIGFGKCQFYLHIGTPIPYGSFGGVHRAPLP